MVFTVSITIKKKIEGTNSDVAPLDQVITFPFYLKMKYERYKMAVYFHFLFILIFYSEQSLKTNMCLF